MRHRGSMLLVAALVTAPLGAPAPASETDVGPALVGFHDVPDELVEVAGWAVGLFGAADLELPPLRFVHHGDSTAPCAGRRGRHRSIDGVSVIDLCTTQAGPLAEWLLLHETSHAWATVGLTDERKEAFRELRGWTAWSDHAGLAWHENGSEQAAEIMVWGLIDRPVGVARIHNTSCADLEAGYRALTGRPPLHGYRDHC